MGSTGVKICWILSAWTNERTSSLPVAIKSLRTFSVSFPAFNILCPWKLSNAMRMLNDSENKIKLQGRTQEPSLIIIYRRQKDWNQIHNIWHSHPQLIMKHVSQIPQKNLWKSLTRLMQLRSKNQINIYSNRDKQFSRFDIPNKKAESRGKSDSRKSSTNPPPQKRPNNITISIQSCTSENWDVS